MKKYKIINIILVVVTVLSILTSGVPAMAQGKVNRAAGTATISAILFEDLNSDGKQDPNESGIEGITMRLLDDSGTEIKKTVTDKAGRYTFDELASGMYQLKIDYPLGYVKVTSGPLPFSSEGFSSHFDLDDDETYTGGWIGFNSTDPSITGTVFNDENKSGIKDTSEKGIAGIDLGLYLIGSSTLVQTTKSDANGNYSFTKITPDKSYEVKALSIPSKYEVIENNNFDKNGKSIQFDLKTQDKKTNVNLALYENIPVTDISVEPKELIQFVGDTGKLKVTITPNNATDKEVTYASLDPSVMTVDQDGNWEAKAVGNTIITVTTKNGKTAYVRVTVKEILADGISVEPKILDQYVGDTGKLKVTITPDNTTNKNVSYMSVDPSILTIDQEGNWVAKSPGNTMVLVTTSNGKMAVVQVIVREKPVLPDKIVVEPKVLDQFVGDTGKLKVTYQPSNTNVKDATFTSVNPEIMTVDQEGNWEAKSPGVTVIIVLTSNNKMATVSVTVREKDIPVEKVKVEPSILDQYVGDTGTLNVTITPANATNKNVTFTSANPEIMTVDASGNWVAKAVGRTEITVTASNGVTGTVQVIVREREIPVEDIKVEPSILDQYVGDTGTLNVTITPANATNKNVTFSSLNPEIMTVDASGNWVAKAVGSTTIIVTTSSGKTAVVQVTVREREVPVTSIKVEPSVLDQYVGDKGTLKVTITPNNATNKNVTFTSANPEIMTVDASGNWVAKAVGRTEITVTASNGVTGTVQVIVREREIPVEEIKVEPSILDQYVGDTGTLNVTITPANATNKNVTFSSLNPEIMTVDASGNWVAKAVGTTTIIVTTSNGKNALVQVTVREREVPVTSIKVEPSVLDQYVGDKGTLKVTITPDNATNKNVTFTSANPEIMTVDALGNWEAKAVGKTKITVTASNGMTAIVEVTVRKREGVGVTFYDFPKYLGYFIEKGTGTAKNFDDDYNSVPPHPDLGPDYYKVKKVGYVTVKDTGLYTFSIEVDDNGAVYLDDEKIIDRDNITGGTLSNFRYLRAGQTIRITTEHFNKEAPVSYFHLRWQTPSNPYSPKAIPDSEITME